MTVRGLFICCGNIGTKTVFTICEKSGKDIFNGQWKDISDSVKNKEVDWFEIIGNDILVSVF